MSKREQTKAGTRRTQRLTIGLPLLMLGALLASSSGRAQSLPDRLADSTFWRLVSTMSEPAGYFRSENFVSNETNWQRVIPPLLSVIPEGGAYLGVGPEQNFTYLVAFKPRIAFIVDIRRQNLLQHLWYKAVIELSSDRADFLSRLFGRARPPRVDSTTSADSLLTAIEAMPPDSALFVRTFQAVRDLLVNRHHFALSAEDLASLHHVDSAFYYAGTSLNYSFGGSGFGGGRGMPTFGQLMRQTDGTELNRSFIGSEANYRVLRDMQLRNVIVPIVGDFGGDKALRAVGEYLRAHGAVVNAFYLSNVEQYLFSDNGNTNGGYRNFYTTVSQLPLDSTSTFIRSYTNRGRGSLVPPANGGIGGMMRQLTSGIQDVVAAFKAGRIIYYEDVIGLSR